MLAAVADQLGPTVCACTTSRGEKVAFVTFKVEVCKRAVVERFVANASCHDSTLLLKFMTFSDAQSYWRPALQCAAVDEATPYGAVKANRATNRYLNMYKRLS